MTLMKKNSMSLIESLPQEIIMDILSRLPPISLFQIKFVCRSWRNLAQDPLLLLMHNSYMNHSDPSIILHSDCPVRNQIYYLDLNEENRMVKTIHVPPLPDFDLVGSCNGLLCLCDMKRRDPIYILNPFIRHCTELPVSEGMISHHYGRPLLGFGFNPTTNEYKVIKVANYPIPRLRRGPARFTTDAYAEIFTIGSHTWRSLGSLPYRFLRLQSQTLVNGRLHWFTWQTREDGLDRKLLSFDIDSELFQEVATPECGSFDNRGSYLMVLKDCLSAVVYQNCRYWNFDIWVMRDYTVKESWIKKFSIDGHYLPRGLADDRSFRTSFFKRRQAIRVVCVLKNEEVLFEYKCRALVSYDPKSGEFKDFMYHGMPNWFKAVVPVGSGQPQLD
ncbi:putative F-box and associated interaction domains-containing protein [Tripterygium wilfordii]|uniref:Putative F-box and associated interaction domains-containing protein n=1 Tax=Tripterygium wilfordii TaxID=458696 RepID=A0A7J7DIM0_TRIWF|nr:F-box protein At3g07870-like [Tripterygium wilfordii]KAF5746139.1 putative F-box and associated interaction domains-containing protein [Tripterygium wilfordii]